MIKKVRQLSHDRIRLPRPQPLQVAPEGVEQLRLINNVGERDDGKNEQRNDRKQRVVSHGAGQKNSLVSPKALQRLDRESTRMLQYNAGIGHNYILQAYFADSIRCPRRTRSCNV